MVDRLLHLQTSDERPWRFLLPVIVLAFAVRAAIALCGDFVLHPDEVMQYLEPAHRLVFGNGVTYWEFFYGARAWLVPGMVAGMLKVFDLVGLGEPFWYVGGVKLMFCAISLLIPVGMYFFRGGILGSYRRGLRYWLAHSGCCRGFGSDYEASRSQCASTPAQ